MDTPRSLKYVDAVTFNAEESELLLAKLCVSILASIYPGAWPAEMENTLKRSRLFPLYNGHHLPLRPRNNPSAMHPCLYITEIVSEIFEYCAMDGPSPLARLARTCHLFRESALDILWRELDDFGPLMKCLPPDLWEEQACIVKAERRIRLRFLREPTATEWNNVHKHAHRVREIAFCHQRYTESGALYQIDWFALSVLSRHLASARPANPFLPNVRVLHFEYYDQYPGFWMADCFTRIAGPSLTDIYLQCDSDAFPETMRVAEFTLSLPRLAYSSPNLQCVSIVDTRPYSAIRYNAGLSGILAASRTMQHFACSSPVRSTDVALLARQPQLSSISVYLVVTQLESSILSKDIRSLPAFRSLESLSLQVTKLEVAASFIGFVEHGRLTKLRIITPMWSDEAELQNCFKNISRHASLQDLGITVYRPKHGLVPFTHGAPCTAKLSSLALLFGLHDLLTFSLSADAEARFETDLDDAGVEGMARAWQNLRSLSIAQGSWAPRGTVLAPTRITMKALLALRTHCPNMGGLSISLDTTSFDAAVVQAAVRGAADTEAGKAGHSLRKLNIDARSTPVSNPSIAAQVLHGLFPNLDSIHDGHSVAWSDKRTDWQEVTSILRGMKSPAFEPMECDWVDEEEVEDMCY